jgi:hypothetical protein
MWVPVLAIAVTFAAVQYDLVLAGPALTQVFSLALIYVALELLFAGTRARRRGSKLKPKGT